MIRNRLCKTVKKFFQHRYCFTLVQPVDNINQLPNLKDMEWSEMSQAFRDKADAIYKHLTSKVKPMGLNGIVFDGTLLTAYIDNLVN